MHTKTVKSILSAQNGMNLYRGCSHGCIYCDARSTCYQFDHRFEDIEVKENAVELLEQELIRKRKKCMISTGSMSDPYIPLEKQLLHTRKCLELINKYEFGLAIQTKSNLILRDLDLLKQINQKAKCVVEMTLTTYDDALCKIVEPAVCTTSERAEVLYRMRDEGIPTVVWMTPILPWINDTGENIDGLLDICIKAKVKGIISFGLGLTLRDGDREYFYQKLEQHFPGLKQRYINKYGLSYEIASDNYKAMNQRLRQRCKEHQIMVNEEEIFTYMHTYESKMNQQLSLFDLM